MPASSDASPNNLPVQLTTLIGRSREIDALTRLLDDDGVRFVTLTGPGGSGKTRLAIEVASAKLGAYGDGVFLVNLAPLTEPSLIASTIAQVLGVRESGRALISDALLDFMHDRRLLLVLDNFEQVIDGAPLVGDLLQACPNLQIMVTSRAALHIRGEREFPVPPLAIPDRSRPLELRDLRRYAAVSLFIERAQAVNPGLAVTEAVGRQIAEICARLDGLPLAIELAAARTKLLTPAAMLSRLDRRFSLLTDGARDLPERQRTLRKAIAWSYDLLDVAERALFRRLSVFAGGCSLEAAEAVCVGWRTVPEPSGGSGSGSGQEAAMQVFDGIASLVDNNLLQRAEVQGSEVRFGMLETIREFGLDALAASGEIDEAHRLHSQVFLALAVEAEPHLTERSNEVWLDKLDREHDNLRAALRWSIEHHREDQALRLAGSLGQFWQFRGYVSEGRQWLDAVLTLGSAAPTTERAQAHTAAGMLAIYQGDFGVARDCHEQSLAIHRELADQWSAAVAVNDLGTVALYQGDYATARSFYEQSLSIRENLQDRRGSAVSLANLGLVAAAQADLGRAREFHERSLALRRELDDRAGITRSLNRLGIVATEQRDYPAARRFLSEATTLAKEDGDRQALAASLTSLGAAAVESGDSQEAGSLFEEAVSIRRELGDRIPIPWSLWHLARLAIARGDLTLARTHGNEAIALVRETGDKHGIALWLNELGDLALGQGDFAEARTAHQEGLSVRRQLGDESGAAVIMAKLAELSDHDGDVVQARALLEESVAILRRLDDRPGLAASLTNLAQLLFVQGQLEASEAQYMEAVVLQHELGNVDMAALCLRGLAALAEARHDEERAARLRAVADALCDPSCTSPPASLDTALACAQGDDAVRKNLGTAALYPDGLSEREVDVLRLIAAGRSNQAIAAELVISVNTVFRHVSNVFAKIGASNRVEAAGYAQRHGLV